MTTEETTMARATLERFRSGDPAAFEAIIRAYGPLVRANVARFWRSVFDQEEVMQEVWIHVFRQRESLDLERVDSFRGWLAVLARRRALDLLRAAGSRAGGVERSEDAFDLMSVPAEQEHSAQDRELHQAVELFASQLKQTWRQFFELHFVQGLDYEEVAAQLKISRLRCKYMKKVIAARARRNKVLMLALGRFAEGPDAS